MLMILVYTDTNECKVVKEVENFVHRRTNYPLRSGGNYKDQKVTLMFCLTECFPPNSSNLSNYLGHPGAQLDYLHLLTAEFPGQGGRGSQTQDQGSCQELHCWFVVFLSAQLQRLMSHWKTPVPFTLYSVHWPVFDSNKNSEYSDVVVLTNAMLAIHTKNLSMLAIRTQNLAMLAI